jgi:hypothetical protein
MPIAIPVRVQGHDPDGTPWQEMSITTDADFGGAAFMLKHPVELGHALHVVLPLPKSLRRHDLNQPGYHIYVIVRNAGRAPAGQRVGVMFLGRSAPRGYAENPGGRFLLPSDHVTASDARGERRHLPRHELTVPLKVSRNEPGAGPTYEQTISNNIGLAGTMVFTSLPVARGDKVVVEDMQGDLHTGAEVQNVFVGPDNVSRMNLRFFDDAAAEGVRRILKRAGISAG